MIFMRRKNKMSAVMRKAYGRKYNLGPQEMVIPAGSTVAGLPMTSSLVLRNPLAKMNKKQKSILVFGLIAIAFLVKSAVAVFYYNLLVDTQQNMLAAYANVQALVQRKNDIAINLSKAVYDYSEHEQQVFTSIVTLRSFMNNEGQLPSNEQLQQLKAAMAESNAEIKAVPKQQAGSDIMTSLSKLMAVAEQYPDLKLSTNFESLMAALVQVESDLALERIKFNDQTNIYTTNVAKFPGNLFAWIFRFETRPYFDADTEAKAFKIIGY